MAMRTALHEGYHIYLIVVVVVVFVVVVAVLMFCSNDIVFDCVIYTHTYIHCGTIIYIINSVSPQTP